MQMPFGKYKGWDLNDIPINYLLWLSEELSLTPYFRLQVEAVLDRKFEQRDAEGDRTLTDSDRKRLVALTPQDISLWWDYYAKIFKSEFYGVVLRKPNFVIERSRRYMGYWAPDERKLMLNNHYILPQERFENILIHEMCHQYVTEMNIVDSSPHGRKWRNIAARLSSATGNPITICDEEIYAPNRYFRQGELVMLPAVSEPKKKEPVTVKSVEDSYEGFIEELSNM